MPCGGFKLSPLYNPNWNFRQNPPLLRHIRASPIDSCFCRNDGGSEFALNARKYGFGGVFCGRARVLLTLLNVLTTLIRLVFVFARVAVALFRVVFAFAKLMQKRRRVVTALFNAKLMPRRVAAALFNVKSMLRRVIGTLFNAKLMQRRLVQR